MHGPRRRLALLVSVTALSLAALAQTALAAVEQPFGARFSANARGDVTIAANTLMTCPDAGGSEAECLTAREGGAGPSLNNNGYTMELVDVDADAGTFDSSRATLALPAGAEVLFAGLYYGARTSAGTGGAAAPAAASRGTVLFQPPGAAGYSTLAATVFDSSSIAASYVGFADVTAAVRAAGAGVYSVANVQAGSGVDRYAGWSLVVAYADPAAPPRSLRVYDGLASIASADPALQIPISGLETPPAGAVKASVGVVAYEGDRGSSGDRLLLNGIPLFDAASPANNVFNSSIGLFGVNAPGKTPDYVNQLGFDANLIRADGILANDATTATLEESTTLEQYLTQAVSVSVELDPAALEPPAPPPPPATSGGTKGDSGKPAKLALDVDVPREVVRPEAVVSLRVTVEAEGSKAASAVRVCNRLPAQLRLLRAPGAKLEGGRACWTVGKLPRGGKRTLVTTARVEAKSRRTLRVRTVASAANARTGRATSLLRVAPLPIGPCARLALTAGPVAHASC